MIAIRLFAAVFLVGILLSGSVAAEPRAYLRSNVLVDGDTVKLGDVFDGAGKLADRVIAHAPPPGHTMVLRANWLYRVARAYGVSWRPNSELDQSTVERRSTVIENDRIRKTILDALQRKYPELRQAELDLDNRVLRLFLPLDMPDTLQTEAVTYDPVGRRFTARVVAPDDRPGAIRQVIAGYAYPLTRIPMLAHRLDRNDIIRKSDIEWKAVRSDAIDNRMITDAAGLVGLSPRRPIAADRPIRDDEVQPPVLVNRGKSVTIALETPLMQLSAMGKALQSGAKGDVVRVQNTSSGKIISAVVVGEGRVAVSSQNNLALR